MSHLTHECDMSHMNEHTSMRMIPHENILGMQRVLNPSTGKYHISTLSHMLLVQPIPLGVIFSKAVSKLKAQTLHLSFATF